MRKLIHEMLCPRCLTTGLKLWDELSADERMIIERHPSTAAIAPEERKKHRFCMRCLYFDADRSETVV